MKKSKKSKAELTTVKLTTAQLKFVGQALMDSQFIVGNDVVGDGAMGCNLVLIFDGHVDNPEDRRLEKLFDALGPVAVKAAFDRYAEMGDPGNPSVGRGDGWKAVRS